MLCSALLILQPVTKGAAYDPQLCGWDRFSMIDVILANILPSPLWSPDYNARRSLAFWWICWVASCPSLNFPSWPRCKEWRMRPRTSKVASSAGRDEDMYVRCPVQFVVESNNPGIYIPPRYGQILNPGADVQVRCCWCGDYCSPMSKALEKSKSTHCATSALQVWQWPVRQVDGGVINKSSTRVGVVCSMLWWQHWGITSISGGSLLTGKCPQEKNWVNQYKNNNNNNNNSHN